MSNRQLSLYNFEGFSLDADEKCLRYADEIVSLTPKAYDTLLVLLRHGGRMVEKETLLTEIWPDTFVEESTLAQNILTLRKTLSRYKKDVQFIATVPSRGYRFVANVEELFSDEEILVVEKHTRTKILAEQSKIHDSGPKQTNETAISPFKRRARYLSRRFTIAGTAMLGIAVLAIGFAAINYFTGLRFADSKFQKFRVNSLVSSPDISSAVLSPNGKYLAMVNRQGEGQALTLRQIENGNPIVLIPKIPGRFIGAAFSPDGEQIYYTVSEAVESTSLTLGSLYKIPLLGGVSQKILTDIDSAPAISPDMGRIAFTRQDLEKKETALVVFDIEGKNERIIATRNIDKGFTRGGAAWSPDGRLLSCTVNQLDNGRASVQVAVLAADSGEQKFISSNSWSWAGKTVWLKDGSGIITVAYGAKSPNLNDEIWLISYPDGKGRSITNGINGILGISVNAESNSIAAVRSNKVTSFNTASLNNLDLSNPILTKTGDDSLVPLGANWTPDGQIIYSSTQNGNADIWTVNADGGSPQLLISSESAEFAPSVSVDGRFLIFLSNRSGLMSVWRTKSDNTDPVQVTDSENVTDAIISPDGSAVFFVAQAPQSLTQVLWRVSINGESKTRMTSYLTYSPRISPDGKSIACYLFNPNSQKMDLTLISTETGEIIRRLNSPRSEAVPPFDWTRNGENLLMILRQNNSSGLWKLQFDNSHSKKLYEWSNDSIYRFAVSKDGERVFYEKGIETNSVVLLNDLPIEE